MITEILLLMALIMLNAFFAASEMALISLSDSKIRIMVEEGNKKARLIKNLLDEPSHFLATIQIGITLAGFLASAFASEAFAGRVVNIIKLAGIPFPEAGLKTLSVVLVTVTLSYFTLVLGELVPKRLAMKKAEPISMFAVRPLKLLSTITSPFVKLLALSTNFFVRLLGINPDEEDEKVTEEEIRMMVDVGEERGAIDEYEKLMINNIFEFNNKTAANIMTHRTDIGALPIDATLKDVTAFLETEQYSRIPVFEDTIDNIIGILYAKDLVYLLADNADRDSFNLKNVIRQPYIVPESKRTDELFRELQKKNIHIAIVIDEYGGTAGLVTIEDLIEEIVGNISDEYDEEEEDFQKVDENTVIIKGTTSLYDVEDYLEVKLPSDEYETLSGFLIGQLGKIPEKDDNPSIEFNELVFKIEEVDEKRISRVKVCKT